MPAPDVRTDPSFLSDVAAAWNERDVDRLMAFMADDCEFRTADGAALEVDGVDVSTFHDGRIAMKDTFLETRIARTP